jgi:hypothetical protein
MSRNSPWDAAHAAGMVPTSVTRDVVCNARRNANREIERSGCERGVTIAYATPAGVKARWVADGTPGLLEAIARFDAANAARLDSCRCAPPNAAEEYAKGAKDMRDALAKGGTYVIPNNVTIPPPGRKVIPGAIAPFPATPKK